MNIDDVADAKVPEDSELFGTLYDRQSTLIEKYSSIETRNGFWHPGKILEDNGQDWSRLRIDDAQFQNWIKNMFWRVTEEIAEALENPCDLSPHWQERWAGDSDLRHFWEEIADAMHFLMETSWFLRFYPWDIQESWNMAVATELESSGRNDAASLGMRFICALGLTANCLKNKPWKVTHMQTDEKKFRDCLATAWRALFTMCQSLHATKTDLFLLYMKKADVNSFRQRSNY